MSSPDTGRHSRAAGLQFEATIYAMLKELVGLGCLACATKIEPEMRSVGRGGKPSFVPTKKQGPDFVVCSQRREYLAIEVKYTKAEVFRRSAIPIDQSACLRSTDGMLAVGRGGTRFLIPFIDCPWKIARSAESLRFDDPLLRRYQFSDSADLDRVISAHLDRRRRVFRP